ncbi:3-hydroxydecanoyl-ACP dehydratase [Vibrio breoganii]|uniref:3-hydroxydecanoyl-ACP dehydratase n=1 Tax=Vibrio breoganii TaxID=553239 RepID=A0AAP8MZU1_9VIBR|nr:hotdog family protein [Vibrio breoganii]PMP14050.1 3-hydroxydecanoyl-ACP dehydratase [Vibrio breoganii]
MTKYPPVEQLLPHDKPMIFIDHALEILEDSICCSVVISPENPFYSAESQSVPAYVGIEFMAQSIAAWSGYHAKLNNLEPPIGFLLGSRRYSIEATKFPLGQELVIKCQKIIEDKGMAVFSGCIEVEKEVVASCHLNVFVPSDEQLKNMNIRTIE